MLEMRDAKVGWFGWLMVVRVWERCRAGVVVLVPESSTLPRCDGSDCGGEFKVLVEGVAGIGSLMIWVKR